MGHGGSRNPDAGCLRNTSARQLRTMISDTSAEAQRVLEQVHRAMPAWRKWALVNGMYRFGRELHASGVRMRRPDASPSQIRDDWIAIQIGAIPDLPTPLAELSPVFEPFELRVAVE